MAPFNPNYDPFANIAGYEDYARSFLGANDENDVAHVKSRIDAERRRDELLSQGGFRGVLATLGAGALDPINLIPVGGNLVAVTRTGRALAGAVRTGAYSQPPLSYRKPSFTARRKRARWQKVQAISGCHGARWHPRRCRGCARSPAMMRWPVVPCAAAGTTVSWARRCRAGDFQLAEEAQRGRPSEVPRETIPEPLAAEGGSVGAAVTRGTTLDEETIASALGVEKALVQTSPTLRTAASPSLATRRAMQDLADQPLDFRKNAEGLPTAISVESLIKQHRGP
jgi:hypothetical protein